jgi:hypothetical protein
MHSRSGENEEKMKRAEAGRFKRLARSPKQRTSFIQRHLKKRKGSDEIENSGIPDTTTTELSGTELEKYPFPCGDH